MHEQGWRQEHPEDAEEELIEVPSDKESRRAQRRRDLFIASTAEAYYQRTGIKPSELRPDQAQEIVSAADVLLKAADSGPKTGRVADTNIPTE